MTNIGFFLGMLEEVVLGEHLKNSGSCCLNDVQLAEEVFFVLVVYLSLADEDVVK